ncbi:MAG TPA: MIP family channel protein [Dehalococcoidia bacterium]|nr:MIP family channel protein [Dehalococcoidia bacterium]
MAQWELSAESLGFTAEDFGAKTWRAVLAELIATLLFVFVGAGSVVVVTGVIGASPGDDAAALTAIALAHGLAIAVVVAGTAKISGGHVNPAVTFGAVISGRMKLTTGILYVGAQLAGAVIGALLIKAAVVGDVEGNLGAHALNLNALDGKGGGVLVEAVLTFVLVFTVFATAIDRRGMGNLAPIAIGLAILIDHLVGVPLTGASMNPARSFGPALVADAWDNHWVYWVGPLAGGGIAALAYYLTFMWGRDED